jgi:hypothetical protein
VGRRLRSRRRVGSVGSCLLAWWLLAGDGWAAQYFIATDGSDSGNGSITQPWLTVAKAQGVMAPGDILYYRAGTYNHGWASNTPNGTGATARIVISANPINRPCTGYNLTAAAWAECMKTATYEPVIWQGSQARIAMEGHKEWIVFEGIQLPGPHGSSFPVRVACTGSHGTNPPTCDAGVTAACSNDLVFAGLQVSHSIASTFIGHAHARVWVLGSKAWNCGSDSFDHCMYWTGEDSVVMGNEFFQSRGTGSQYYRQVSEPTCYPLGTGLLVEGNAYHDNALCGTVIAGWTQDTTYQNNLSVRNSCGVSVNSYKGDAHQLYNNTLLDNRGTDVQILAAGDNAILKNNTYSSIDIDDGATGVVQENNYLACPTCTQPTFVDRNAGDYRLAATDTVLKDQGQSLALAGVSRDKDGVTRPQGNAYDIGAYEFQAGTTDFAYRLSTNIPAGEDLAVVQGESATTTITVTRDSGTAVAVTFAASSLPTGMTASFAPASCTPSVTTCSTVLTLTSSQRTPEGGFTVQVSGTTAGLTRSTPVDITVTCQIL